MDKNEGENLLFSLNICGFSTETEYSESCSVPLLCQDNYLTSTPCYQETVQRTKLTNDVRNTFSFSRNVEYRRIP